MAKEINVIGHKIEIGAGSSSGHPGFKGQQTSDIRSWIRIDGGEWYKIAHGFNILQVLELFEYCKRESQVFAIFEMLGDVLRVKAKPPLNESVLPISDVSGSLPTDEQIEIKFPSEVGQKVIMEADMNYDEVRLANYYRRQGAKWLRDLLRQ